MNPNNKASKQNEVTENQSAQKVGGLWVDPCASQH